MTTEEAIRILEKEFDKSCGNYRYQNAYKLDLEDAIWLAIAALRAQQKAEKNEPQSNADRIRAMSDEKLSEHNIHTVQVWDREGYQETAYCCSDWYITHDYQGALEHEIEWLQQPADIEVFK